MNRIFFFSNTFRFRFYCAKDQTKIDTKLANTYLYIARGSFPSTFVAAGIQRGFEKRVNVIE